jgi:hypothetical protein
MADRLEDIAGALKKMSAGIEKIVLFEDPEGLQAGWRAVFDGLITQGTVVERRGLEPVGARGDLGASRKAGFVPKGDGSLQLFRPPGNLEAAEEVAALLSENSSKTVVIWADEVLDQALWRHGLATTGGGFGSESSLATVLPLVIALGWSPQDPAMAAELLALPDGPVPHDISRELLKALQEWPAVGSGAWVNALDRIDRRKYESSVLKMLEVIFKASVDRKSAYPASEIKHRRDVIHDWLEEQKKKTGADEKIWEDAIKQCDELKNLVTAFGRDRLSLMELSTLIEQSAQSSPSPWPEQAGLFTLGSPGGVVGEIENVVWWDFSLSRYSPPMKIPLSKSEEKELAGMGVRLPDPGREAVRQAESWRRPLLQASKSVLLICPQRGTDGEENFPHPAWDEVKSRLSEWHLEKELVGTRIFGRKMPPKERSQLLALPGQITKLEVEKGRLKLREKESPSSLGPMIGCPLQYVLKYTGELEAGISAGLPDAFDSRVRGSLSHLLLAEVLEKKKKGGEITPDEAREMAGKLFDERAPRLMAVLFLPGNDAARAEVRRVVCQAAESLVRLFDRMGLCVREIEKRYDMDAMGIKVTGRLDLLAGDPEKVIDLKWSGAAYRSSEMEAGASYQLATYSRLISEKFPPVAYFIIRENRLLSTDKKAFTEAEEVKGPKPAVIWEALVKAFEEVSGALKAGTVSSGVGYEPLRKSGIDMGSIRDGRLVLPPPCFFCDFGSLCGVEE